MQSIYLTGKKSFKSAEIAVPAPSGPGEVLVRIKAVGICGSDIHYYLHGSTTAGRPKYPFIIGHECAGEVVGTGSKSRRFKPGDRVFIEPNLPCRGCDMCKAGNFNFCRTPKFLGYPGQMDGALRQFIVMPSENLYRFRKDLAFEEALMAEPLSIALYSLSLASKARIKNAAVLGAGSIGLCLIKAIKVLKGRWRVFSTDIVEERCALSLRNGASLSVNSSVRDATAGILQATEGAGVDAVFECAGVPETIDQSLKILKPGGTLFIIGIPAEPVLRLDTDLFRKKGVTITYVRRQNRQALRALRFIEGGLIDVKEIIGPFFALGEAEEAFEMKIKKPGKTVKPVINP